MMLASRRLPFSITSALLAVSMASAGCSAEEDLQPSGTSPISIATGGSTAGTAVSVATGGNIVGNGGFVATGGSIGGTDGLVDAGATTVGASDSSNSTGGSGTTGEIGLVDAGRTDGAENAVGTGGIANTGNTVGAIATGGTGGSTVITNPDPGTGGECNLAGEVGLEIGNLTPDITLYECDGTPIQLYELVCDSAYTFFYSYAGW